jgi:LmbE family N-acetylglucosaminyl deacetylase
MDGELRLMCVLAHPDDESMGSGGIVSKYASEGVGTYLVCATRGERGWFGDADAYPGPDALGRIREAELQSAAAVLGLRRVDFLDYIDGDLSQADPSEVVPKIARLIQEVRPQVVVTFAHDGSYGHPDHIAICQFATAACVAAADASLDSASIHPHRVAKLYYMAGGTELGELWTQAAGDIAMEVDGILRRPTAWPDWAITTNIDCLDHWQTVRDAIRCHGSQVPSLRGFEDWSDDFHRSIWGRQEFYRAYSLVNGGREVEADLFDGLR